MISHKPNYQRTFRSGALLFCAMTGWVFRDQLDVLEAVTGAGCTMATSIIFPIFFYLLLYWRQLTSLSKIANVALLIFSIILTCWFLYQDISKCFQDADA